MVETLYLDPQDEHQEFTAKPKLELVDTDYLNNQRLVKELLEHHREDFAGMHEFPDNNEKAQFITYLKSDLSKDENPAISEAARKFLEEIGETYEA